MEGRGENRDGLRQGKGGTYRTPSQLDVCARQHQKAANGWNGTTSSSVPLPATEEEGQGRTFIFSKSLIENLTSTPFSMRDSGSACFVA